MGNYTTPAAVITVAVLFPTLGILAVGLRFTSRLRAKVPIAIDDWLVVPALALEWIIAGLLIWGGATNSIGHELPPPNVQAPGFLAVLLSNSDQQKRMNRIQYHVDWMAVLTLGLLKASLLMLYRKIFYSTHNRRDVFNIVTHVMLALVVAWTVSLCLALILRCGIHVEYEQQPQAFIAAHCAGPALREAYATSDFIMDVIIWTMPLPKVWTLHMPTRRKVAVALVFLVGILTIAASATRVGIYYDVLINWLRPTDGEILVTHLMFWTMIEVGLSLIVVCLPTLRSLINKFSADGVLSALRSAVSMASLRSQNKGSPDGSKRDATRTPSTSASNHSNSVKHDLRVKDEGSTNVHVSISDVEAQSLPEHGIRVTRELHQSR